MTFWLKVFVQNSTLHGFLYARTVKESEEISSISLQSSKRSFHNIQIFKFAYSALPLFYSLFRLKSSLQWVVYTKSVRESEEISCISLQSSKRSFRKMQIFKFAYCAGRCFIPCLGWNHLCIGWYIRKALKNRKRLVASCYSLWSARFAKYIFLNLHILHFRCFVPCLG